LCHEINAVEMSYVIGAKASQPELFISSVMRSGLEVANEIVFVSLLQIAIRIDQEDGPQARDAETLEGCETRVKQDRKGERPAPGVIDDRFEFLIELCDRLIVGRAASLPLLVSASAIEKIPTEAGSAPQSASRQLTPRSMASWQLALR
jgi:hypothetical protein